MDDKQIRELIARELKRNPAARKEKRLERARLKTLFNFDIGVKAVKGSVEGLKPSLMICDEVSGTEEVEKGRVNWNE